MKVKIKTWEALEKEFGLNKDGNINCKLLFTKGMDSKLPTNRVIDVKIDLAASILLRTTVYKSSTSALKNFRFSSNIVEKRFKEKNENQNKALENS